MSYLNPVKSKSGCTIVTTNSPVGGGFCNALYINDQCGFGFVNLQDSKKYGIVVSDVIDYEISFWVRQPIDLPGFELSVLTFNKQDIQTSTYDIRTSLKNQVLIDKTIKAIDIPNKWYFCRYILYGINQKPVLGQQPKTSLSVGTNLVMSKGTSKLFVNLIAHQAAGIHVWNFKIKPLRTPFNTGFLQPGNILEIWRKNNNNALTTNQIDRAAQQYLIPNNTGQSVINL